MLLLGWVSEDEEEDERAEPVPGMLSMTMLSERRRGINTRFGKNGVETKRSRSN